MYVGSSQRWIDGWVNHTRRRLRGAWGREEIVGAVEGNGACGLGILV